MLPLFATVASPRFTHTILAFLLLGTATAAQNSPSPGDHGPADPVLVDPGIKDASKFDSRRPLSRELETNVPDGFTLVTVGDCIISRPLLQYAAHDEAFRKAVDILKRADVTYGNMETSIFDLRHFIGQEKERGYCH